MKFIQKKTIKNQQYYYFEFPLKTKKRRLVFSRYLGRQLPENLKLLIPQYFNEIALLAEKNLDHTTKKYFKPKAPLPIEQNRFWVQSLHHELFENDLNLFRSLFTTLFILNSNRVEGSKITRDNIEKIIQRKQKPKTSLDLEIINSLAALKFAFSNEMKWNLTSLKKIHALLFHKIAPEIAGRFKKINNTINNQPTTPWKKVRPELSKLLKWFQSHKKRLYPPILALEFHSRFERIHPFEDGNGRTGRILFNAFLLQKGFMPTIFFSENHTTYSNSLLQAQQGRKRKLAHYFIEQTKKTKKAVEQYKKEGILKGGSPQVGQWEINRGKIRKY